MDAKSIIRYCEGKRLKSYLCPAGIWTIGYGHTKNVTANMVATEEQIEKWLEEDYKEAERCVLSLVKVPLTKNQLGALVSFTFNLGKGALSSSTLLRKVNSSDFISAGEEFPKWVYAKVNGKSTKLSGLVKRRKLERSLFEDMNDGM